MGDHGQLESIKPSGPSASPAGDHRSFTARAEVGIGVAASVLQRTEASPGELGAVRIYA